MMSGVLCVDTTGTPRSLLFESETNSNSMTHDIFLGQKNQEKPA